MPISIHAPGPEDLGFFEHTVLTLPYVRLQEWMRLVRTAASLRGKASAAEEAMAGKAGGLQGLAEPAVDEILSSEEEETDEESDFEDGSGSEGDSEDSEEEEGEEEGKEEVADKVGPAAMPSQYVQCSSAVSKQMAGCAGGEAGSAEGQAPLQALVPGRPAAGGCG